MKNRTQLYKTYHYFRDIFQTGLHSLLFISGKLIFSLIFTITLLMFFFVVSEKTSAKNSIFNSDKKTQIINTPHNKLTQAFKLNKDVISKYLTAHTKSLIINYRKNRRIYASTQLLRYLTYQIKHVYIFLQAAYQLLIIKYIFFIQKPRHQKLKAAHQTNQKPEIKLRKHRQTKLQVKNITI